MRTSEYMDKQIMGLSRSQSDDDFSDFGSTLSNCGAMDQVDFAKVGGTRAGDFSHKALIYAIDQKIKEHTDNLVYKVDSLSAHLSQLESRTRQIENTVDDFKECVDYNHGKTDGKLRELENILREILGGIQDLRDKQEIAEARVQLEKLEMSKRDSQLEKRNSNIQTNFVEGALASEAVDFHSPVSHSHQLPSSLPNFPPALPNQNPPSRPAATAPQFPTHLLQNQIPSISQPEIYHPPPVRASDNIYQQYQMLSTQQSQPPPNPQSHHPYQPAPQLAPSSQFPPMAQLQPPNINQSCCPSNFYPEDVSYQTSRAPAIQKYPHPSDNYSHVQQSHWGPTKQTYFDSSSSEFPSLHSQAPGRSNFDNMYPYGGSPSRLSSSFERPSEFSKSASFQSCGSSYSHLPTAKILPHAIATASDVDNDELGPNSTVKRIPSDEVVDKVVAMGFRRDLVRAVVRKLTENGHPADFNAVLDRVMNNGEI